MQKLFLNTTEKIWYDQNGSELSDGNPRIPFGNTEKIAIQCCTKTPDAGTSGVNPDSDWAKDTQFALEGISALLSADNNFTRRLSGRLKIALEPGDVTTIIVVIPGATPGKIPSSGIIRILGASGECEVVEYSSRTISGSDVTFCLSRGSTLKNSYPQLSIADCPESLYMQAAMDAVESDPGSGLFAFNITAYSAKLREKIDYADAKTVEDTKGLELLIFTVGGNKNITTRGAFICDTFQIPVPMAEPNPNPVIPATAEDGIAAIVNALLSHGFELRFSENGLSEWHDVQTVSDKFYCFRAKSAGTSSIWSHSIALPAGIQGESINAYIAYASDGNGTDFTTLWEENTESNLKYIAIKMSVEKIASPSAADFAGLWTRFGGVDLRSFWEFGGEDPEPVSAAWENITGKPDNFTPSVHVHATNEIIDGARQKVKTLSNPDSLYLDSPILINSSVRSSTTLSLSFSTVKDLAGNNYTGAEGDFFTWEYHVQCSQNITRITPQNMIAIELPTVLPRITPITFHAFVIRAIYSSTASNKLTFYVNYAYSYGV